MVQGSQVLDINEWLLVDMILMLFPSFKEFLDFIGYQSKDLPSVVETWASYHIGSKHDEKPIFVDESITCSVAIADGIA